MVRAGGQIGVEIGAGLALLCLGKGGVAGAEGGLSRRARGRILRRGLLRDQRRDDPGVLRDPGDRNGKIHPLARVGGVVQGDHLAIVVAEDRRA